jgi:hypothetical protein
VEPLLPLLAADARELVLGQLVLATIRRVPAKTADALALVERIAEPGRWHEVARYATYLGDADAATRAVVRRELVAKTASLCVPPVN